MSEQLKDILANMNKVLAEFGVKIVELWQRINLIEKHLGLKSVDDEKF